MGVGDRELRELRAQGSRGRRAVMLWAGVCVCERGRGRRRGCKKGCCAVAWVRNNDWFLPSVAGEQLLATQTSVPKCNRSLWLARAWVEKKTHLVTSSSPSSCFLVFSLSSHPFSSMNYKVSSSSSAPPFFPLPRNDTFFTASHDLVEKKKSHFPCLLLFGGKRCWI